MDLFTYAFRYLAYYFSSNEASEIMEGQVPRAYTKAWCCSHNFNHSVLFDFRNTAKDRTHAYDCLRREYGDAIVGVEQLRPLMIRTVFADAQTAERALLDGVPCGRWRVMPTVVLDSSSRHTVLCIKHLPLEDEVTTHAKLRQSLQFLEPGQQVRFITTRSPSSDMYEGNMLVIIRGDYPIPRQRYIYLSEYMDSFAVDLYFVASYCHLCDSLDRHPPRQCPLLIIYGHLESGAE